MIQNLFFLFPVFGFIYILFSCLYHFTFSPLTFILLVDYHCETVKVFETLISQEPSKHHDSDVLKFMCYSECSR